MPDRDLRTDIRLNEDGTLDEIVAWGCVHLEQMDDAIWLLLIDTADGVLLRVPISAKNHRTKVNAFAEKDGRSEHAAWITEAAKELAEWEALASLTSRREQPWIGLWQKEQNKPDTLPDYGALLAWLSEKITVAERRREAILDALLLVINDAGGCPVSKEMCGCSSDDCKIGKALELAPADVLPIPMVLHCPECGDQHIDTPQPEKNWYNPPHRSHECQSCGYVWRPADIPTTGVASIATRGTRDGLPSQTSPATRIKALEDKLRLIFGHKDAPAQSLRRIVSEHAAL